MDSLLYISFTGFAVRLGKHRHLNFGSKVAIYFLHPIFEDSSSQKKKSKNNKIVLYFCSLYDNESNSPRLLKTFSQSFGYQISPSLWKLVNPGKWVPFYRREKRPGVSECLTGGLVFRQWYMEDEIPTLFLNPCTVCTKKVTKVLWKVPSFSSLLSYLHLVSTFLLWYARETITNAFRSWATFIPGTIELRMELQTLSKQTLFSFLGLLKATNRVTWNNRNLFFHCLEDQKSEIQMLVGPCSL